ncbi:MAG: hypothetical protein WC497_04440 [Patescibacteria group bacterium]
MKATDWRTVLMVWWYYLMAFIPGAPRIGTLAEAVCIFVQSFGRNMLDDDILNRVIWGLRQNFGFQDEAVFDEMVRRGYEPGASNRALARHAVCLAKRYLIPIISQWEVVYAIYLMDPGWYRANANNIDAVWPPHEGYFATYHVKEQSRERMRCRRLTGRPIELAHPAMLIRAVPILWKLGLNPIVESVSWHAFWKHELWVWDGDSIQPWTRGFAHWLNREIIFGRILHLVMAVLPAWFHGRIPLGLRQRLPGRWLAFRPAVA